MRNCTAAAATWRTGSKSSSLCLPIGSAYRPCEAINCGSIRHRLHIDEWSAPVRTESDDDGNGAGGHDPAQGTQNRSADSSHCSKSVGPDGKQLSVPSAVLSR